MSSLPPPLSAATLGIQVRAGSPPPIDLAEDLKRYRPARFPRGFGRVRYISTPEDIAAKKVLQSISGKKLAASITTEQRKAWSRLGGQARMAKATPEQRKVWAKKRRSLSLETLQTDSAGHATLGSLGGLATAKLLTPEQRSERAQLGAQARMKSTTSEQRTELAKKAAQAWLNQSTPEQRRELARASAIKRWAGHVPKAKIPGPPRDPKAIALKSVRTRQLRFTPAEISRKARENARKRWARVEIPLPTEAQANAEFFNSYISVVDLPETVAFLNSEGELASINEKAALDRETKTLFAGVFQPLLETSGTSNSNKDLTDNKTPSTFPAT